MDLYHALTDLELVDLYWQMVDNPRPALRRLNVLIAFDYFKGQMPTLLRLKAEGKIERTFLDSQTFGMNQGGCNPGLTDRFDEYKHVVRRIGSEFDWVASMDDRFEDPTHNQVNYDELRREVDGILDAQGRNLADKIVPVVHDRNAADEFLLYAEGGAKLIAIGSKPIPSDEQWVIINEIRAEYGVKIHRFGNLGFGKLVKWRVDSADSARYARATMHGRDMWFWDNELNKPVAIDLRSGNEVQEKHLVFLQGKFGIDLADLLTDVKKIWCVNIYAMQKAQQYLTEVLGI